MHEELRKYRKTDGARDVEEYGFGQSQETLDRSTRNQSREEEDNGSH